MYLCFTITIILFPSVSVLINYDNKMVWFNEIFAPCEASMQTVCRRRRRRRRRRRWRRHRRRRRRRRPPPPPAAAAVVVVVVVGVVSTSFVERVVACVRVCACGECGASRRCVGVCVCVRVCACACECEDRRACVRVCTRQRAVDVWPEC